MKTNNFTATLNWKFPVLIAILFAGASFITSCDNGEDPLAPAPSLTLSTTTASNTPGQPVTFSVTVDAPEGGKTLKTLVNGAADSSLPDVDLAGETSKTVDMSYTIPANATVGSTITISFQAIDKKDQNSTLGSIAVSVSAVPAKQIVEVTSDILADTHWTSDKIYRLNGFIRVGSDVKGSATTPAIVTTATLTIDAGTVIFGKTGTPGGALIIQRGSKIIAEGTASNPIIFTSDKAPGTRKGGDWAGLVLCGQSANNIKGSTGTDGIAELEGSYGAFHGGNPAILDDNSGVLKYVRIEYAGYPINPNQELNGLTFGSVGSGTTVDYVQVTYANDDSFEWFGGTVNPKHLVAYKGIDDDFDTDNGFVGMVQFGLGIRDANIADQSGSNGFEADNDGNASDNLPFTAPKFSNITLIGPKATSGTTISLQYFNGAHLRRNVKQTIINSFITGYPTGIYIDGTAASGSGSDAVTNAENGDIVLKNNVLAGVENWGGNGFGSATTADEKTITGLPFGSDKNHANNPRGRVVFAGNIPTGSAPFINGVFTVNERQIGGQNALPWFVASNTVLAKWTDAGISANVFEPLNGAPTLIPTGATLTTGADFTGYTGFEAVTYKGAFGTTDWTSGWVSWNPGVTDYTVQQ